VKDVVSSQRTYYDRWDINARRVGDTFLYGAGCRR